MPEKYDNINNEILRISKEHKLINDYAARFSRAGKHPDSALISDLGNFLTFLKKDLIRHFRKEEILFFPAALNGDPTYATSILVLKLQKEHGLLEERIQKIVALERHLEREKDRTKLIGKIENFLEVLKNHARTEIMELFPLIDANERCVNLLKDYARRIKGD